MQIVSVEGVSKQYDDRVLFNDVSFGIEQGARIGVIGVNGSGKSTLLKIVGGAEEPDSGQVTYRTGVRVAYLSQQPEMDGSLTVREYMFASGGERGLLLDYEIALAQVNAAPDDLAALERLNDLSAQIDAAQGWDAENQIQTILSRLGVPITDQPLATLSGGQRRRLAMARALIDPADLIILDEPTNHLDADTVAWLETMLARTPAALLLITHDRYVLDRLVQQMIEIDRGSVYQYVGGYNRYLEQKVERAGLAAAESARHNSIMRRELAWLRQGPQGRGTKQKARIERIEAMRAAPELAAQQDLTIPLGTQRLGKHVLDLRHVAKSYGERMVLRDLTLEIGRGERLGIVGPNGVGKSTLLNLLAERAQPDQGVVERGETVRLAYYDQESHALNESQRVIDYIKAEAELVRTVDGEIVTAGEMLERFLFPAALQYALIGTLSGGERRRLYLLRTLLGGGEPPNVLLLDEPSNDLDVQTLAVLETYLDTFSGTLVVASHDRYFLDRVVDHLLVFEGDGRVRTFPGSYSAYAEDRSARQQQERQRKEPQKPAARPTAPSAASRKPRTLSFKERKELETLEARIAELEAEQTRLNAAVSAGDLPYAELQETLAALMTAGQELETAFERWAELAAIAEASA